MRLAIQIEYDGSAFHGWQSQPDGATVQDKLEHALSVIAGERVRAHAAGRTDTGVHALAQVAHFDTGASRPAQAWVRGVNAHLPKQMAVRWAQPVAVDFHARFCARARSYRYLLFNHPVRPALHYGRVHDFSSFRSSECQAPSPVKILLEARVFRRGELVIFEFSAGGFLHHMVRNLIGALLWVGSGKCDAEWMTELLALRDRTQAPPTFMPDGLYFTGVDYDPQWQLPNGGRIIAPLDPLLP